MITCFEKRRHHRLNAALQLSFKKSNGANDSHPEHRCVTTNISMGGTYFICSDWQVQNLNLDEVLKITITIPRQHYDFSWSSTLKTTGKIVRIDNIPERPKHNGVALSFLEDLRFTNA